VRGFGNLVRTLVSNVTDGCECFSNQWDRTLSGFYAEVLCVLARSKVPLYLPTSAQVSVQGRSLPHIVLDQLAETPTKGAAVVDVGKEARAISDLSTILDGNRHGGFDDGAYRPLYRRKSRRGYTVFSA
jgi:hypothetical protein